MRANKRAQPVVSTREGRNNVLVPPGGSDASSSCSSDGRSPRRRLELEDEGSQTMLFDPSNATAISVGEVRYDPSDHTVSLPRNALSSHMMALPRALLSYATTTTRSSEKEGDIINENNDCDGQAGRRGAEGVDWARSPSAAVISTRTPSASTDMLPKIPVFMRTARNGQSAASLRPGCEFVRLQHPRHGEPALFLCASPAHAVGTNDDDDAGKGTNRSSDGSGDPADVFVLYEVQAQMPTNGFGQTWFVGDFVEANEELLVVTPFDVTFFALRQAATHVMRDKFVSAEDLIMGVGQRDCKWPGWGVAQAQCPSLAPVVKEMQSDAVLSRICDVRSVGGENYYRFSEEKMGTWLQGKVRRVASCPAMHALLQLAPADDGLMPVVPLPHAFGVVAEYVVEDLIATAARLCGAVDASS